ncbi:MAG TPA: LTA synthase family protein [Nocardioidaceae bacterium]
MSKAPNTPSNAQVARTLCATGLFTVAWALFCNLALEVSQVQADGPRLLEHTLGAGLPRFLLGSLVVWTLVLLVLSLTGRLWLTVGITGLVAVMVGFANYQKVSARLEPLYPSDLDFLGSMGFLAHMIGFATAAMLVLGVALLVCVALLLGRLVSRFFPPVRRRELPRHWLGLMALRVGVSALCLASLGYAAHFNSPGNKLRDAYVASGATWATWQQLRNYEQNGFVAGLLHNLDRPPMERPDDYSAQTMRDLADRYTRLAARLNQGRDPHALDDVNVVAVLSEAFSDPSRLSGVDAAEDPIPRTRRLLRRTESGLLLTNQYGAGTANMEFETLTGMSMAQFEPQVATPYQTVVPEFRRFPSAVGWFRRHGHDAVAIHPYNTSMYQRGQVYPILGFQRFVHDTTMQSARTIEDNPFISDASAFAEVEHQIATHDRPLLVNLVTIQNHYPTAGEYSDPIPVSGVSGETAKQAGGYLRGLRHTDRALHEFLTSLQHSDEKTIVVFYGDHLPPLWPRSVYDDNGDRTMHETPFFLWSNFTDLPHRPLPTTSAIYFMPMVFDAVGAPLPPYYALLSALREEVPAMEQGKYVDSADRMVEEARLSPRARQLLHDYRLVQYDLSIGKRYSLRQMFYPPLPAANAAGARAGG